MLQVLPPLTPPTARARAGLPAPLLTDARQPLPSPSNDSSPSYPPLNAPQTLSKSRTSCTRQVQKGCSEGLTALLRLHQVGMKHALLIPLPLSHLAYCQVLEECKAAQRASGKKLADFTR